MENSKTITDNRKAFHDYLIQEKYEAGIVLKGSEIKSIRMGRVNLRDAYARVDRGEVWLHNSHIATYEAAGKDTHSPDRARKLLLHKKQIAELGALGNQKGLTLVPLRLYIKDGKAKVELGVGKGKKMYDKREVLARRESDREIERALKTRHR